MSKAVRGCVWTAGCGEHWEDLSHPAEGPVLVVKLDDQGTEPSPNTEVIIYVLEDASAADPLADLMRSRKALVHENWALGDALVLACQRVLADPSGETEPTDEAIEALMADLMADAKATTELALRVAAAAVPVQPEAARVCRPDAYARRALEPPPEQLHRLWQWLLLWSFGVRPSYGRYVCDEYWHWFSGPFPQRAQCPCEGCERPDCPLR